MRARAHDTRGGARRRIRRQAVSASRRRDAPMKAENPPIAESDESFDRINDYFYDRGWTDGLPIIPPTGERVQAMLAGMAGHDPDELVSVVPPRNGRATLRRIAVNAVMAGARPEYLPVVVA